MKKPKTVLEIIEDETGMKGKILKSQEGSWDVAVDFEQEGTGDRYGFVINYVTEQIAESFDPDIDIVGKLKVIW